jgi:uncharacterized protein (DUF1330 family)
MLPFAEPEAGNAVRQEAAWNSLASWDKPAHVIFGAADRVFTEAWGRQFAAHIPGATFTSIEGEGHRPMLFTGPAGGQFTGKHRGDEFAELVLRLIRTEFDSKSPRQTGRDSLPPKQYLQAEKESTCLFSSVPFLSPVREASMLRGENVRTHQVEINAMQPTLEQIRQFLALPNGPIVMVNLLKFKEDGGREEYQKYGMKALQVLEKIGARILFTGQASVCLIGDGDWDQIALVEYPSKLALIRLALSAEYRAAQKHREAGLEGQIAYVVTTNSRWSSSRIPPLSRFPKAASSWWKNHRKLLSEQSNSDN